MSRRRAAEKRKILPDPKYKNVTVSKFISCMMKAGKRSVAEKALYNALDVVEKKTKEDGIAVFLTAIKNTTPLVEVRSRRVGGATYQVPVEVRPRRALALSMRWLILMSRKRSEKTIVDKLAGELLDAYNSRGQAIKKREETHKMAEANKAFSHYRW